MDLSFSPRHIIPMRIALELVANTLNSFALLTETERLSGLNMWVVQTAATLTAEQRRNNRLVFEGLRAALPLEQVSNSFPTWLQQLREEDPVVMRDRVLEHVCKRFTYTLAPGETASPPTHERLLNDIQAYLTCIEHIQNDTLYNAPFDAEIHKEAHRLLNDPPVLQQLLVTHLEQLWKTTFAMEWKRVQSLLNWQVQMFTHHTQDEREEGTSVEEFFHTLTGRQLPVELPLWITDREEIIFVPSWHIGKYVTFWEQGRCAWLFFSEPPNYDLTLHATPMGHPELRARLDTLADETRLRIIELLTQQDEMHAQDIITVLELSQSSASRHLKQLVSMGYLYERRNEGANKTYRLSSFYFARLAHALEQLGSGEIAQRVEHDTTLPQELRRFLDRSGRLKLWPPAKQRDKLLILEHLASFFTPGQVYNEKEVNALLIQRCSIFRDYAALRRALYEYRFMSRTPDGSRYWLTGSDIAEEQRNNGR